MRLAAGAKERKKRGFKGSVSRDVEPFHQSNSSGSRGSANILTQIQVQSLLSCVLYIFK